MKTTLASEGTLREATGGSHPVEVSVVIPCLNEANSLAHCVDKAMKAFREAGLPGEVVVTEMVIKSTQIGAHRGDSHRFVAGQATARWRQWG